MPLATPTASDIDFEARLCVELERRMAVTPAMVHSIDEKGRLISVSDAWLSKLGYAREEVLGRLSSDFLTAASRDYAVREVLPEFFRTGRCENVPYQMVRKDGTIIDVLLSAVLDKELFGRGCFSLAVFTDVTALKRTKRQLADSEERYRMLVDNSSDTVFQLDRELVRRYVSPACRELLGYEPEELTGDRPLRLAHPDDAARLELVFRTLLNGHAEHLSIVVRIRHRDGRWIWIEASVRALNNPDSGATSGIMIALRDISVRKAVEDELAEANRRLQILAAQDGLTGLANRRAFDEALVREHLRAKREKTSLALIMIDVDRFKTFNDIYGHPAGDDCLKRVGAAIAETVCRSGDLAARYGGEEFAVLLPNTDEDGAVVIGKHISHAILSLGIQHDANANGVVTISAGVAAIAGGDGTTEALVANADHALYRAKDFGRNTVVSATRGGKNAAASPSAAA
jgi:diguanylate cyclase (GGDEF)-like protein/PAS domain S-box-containing protein